MGEGRGTVRLGYACGVVVLLVFAAHTGALAAAEFSGGDTLAVLFYASVCVKKKTLKSVSDGAL